MRSAGLHVLVIHQGFRWARDETVDVQQLVAGLLESAPVDQRVRVTVSQGLRLLDVRMADGELVSTPLGSLLRLLRDRPDVAHVWLPIPLVHLVVASLVRLRGVPVLLSPMAMLGEDFAARSWFKPNGAATRWKPLRVRALRALWTKVAGGWVLLSEDERRQARRRGPVAFMPYASYPTDVVRAADDLEPRSAIGPTDGPLAFVGRLDVHRKGLDRMGRWLLTYADLLPRPALVLFSPPGELPPELVEAQQQGLVRWDTETTGAGLIPHLRACRGVILLSRFDGQPRAVREAAHLGVPTVTTPSSGFGEVVPAIGSGVIVDGDHPASVQAGFEAVAHQVHDPSSARAFFDRRAIGHFWWELLRDTAATGALPLRRYAEEFRSAGRVR